MCSLLASTHVPGEIFQALKEIKTEDKIVGLSWPSLTEQKSKLKKYLKNKKKRFGVRIPNPSTSYTGLLWPIQRHHTVFSFTLSPLSFFFFFSSIRKHIFFNFNYIIFSTIVILSSFFISFLYKFIVKSFLDEFIKPVRFKLQDYSIPMHQMKMI